MKKALLFLAVNLIGFTSFAQWNYDNQNFMYSGTKALTIGSSTQVAGYQEADARGLEVYSPSVTMFTMKSGANSLQLINSPIWGCNFYLPNNVPFTFRMNGVTNPSIKIQTNGDVAINTPGLNPAGYRLAVGGKIIAEELKVQLQAQWPDYVFTEYYKLPTLEEVEQHIKDNGHLSNMPSAAEVNCEGFEIGEVTRLQQEKIEELTLYIIELNKKLQAQEKRMQALEAKGSN